MKKNTTNTRKNTRRAAVLAAALAGCMMIGGIAAYFTDADTATNTFTVGKVSLDLMEPTWDPDNARDITPLETIEKDPQIKNDGVNSEFVFLEVSVPYAKNVVTANENGTKNAAADTQLFTYSVNEGWVQVGAEKKDEAKSTITYVYAYAKNDAMTALAKDATTPALFDTVTFANVIEDQSLEQSTQNIVINAYGIQTDNINGGTTAPADVWTVVSNQAPDTAVAGAEDSKTDIKQP